MARLKTTTIPAEAAAEGSSHDLREIFEQQRRLCHDINNPLTAVIGRAQILRMRKDSDPAALKAADAIEESAQRIAQSVRALSALVHRGRDTLGGGGGRTPHDG